MNAARPQVRPARPSDAPAIARIHAEGIAERVATFATTPPSADEVERQLASGALVVVAERDGAVVGFAKLGPYSDPAPYYDGVGELTVYVDRDARGRGAGAALVAGLEAAAARQGYWKLVGKVFASNVSSLRLLRACGWREVGVHLRHGRLEGEWKDVTVMEKGLPASDE